MSAVPNYFELLQLAPVFALDTTQLEAAYKALQAQVHPDRFATRSAAEKRVAMQWATHANEAYRVLRQPLTRAAYLCELNGVLINAESNTAMPAEFLMQQLAWREALDEAPSQAQIVALINQVAAKRLELVKQLAEELDRKRQFAAAAALVRQLMFVEKFKSELSQALQGDQQRTAEN